LTHRTLRERGAKALHLLIAYNPMAAGGSLHPQKRSLIHIPTDKGRYLWWVGRRISIVLHTLFDNLDFKGGLVEAEKTDYAQKTEDLNLLEPNETSQTRGLELLLGDHAKLSSNIFGMELS